TIKLPSITCSSSWAPGCMCQGAAVPGGNSTMLTTVSWTTWLWPSRSLRKILGSFGPGWACASTILTMDGTVTVRLDSRRNSRRMISMVPSLKVSFRRHVLANPIGYSRLNPADGRKFPAAVTIQSCFADDVIEYGAADDC